MLAEHDCNNIVIEQIDRWKKLLIEIDKDLDDILKIIPNKRNIFTKYLNQTNYAYKQYKEIRIITLGLEQ